MLTKNDPTQLQSHTNSIDLVSMDLYADLPLAKGAKASSALDADGKPKASLSSTSSGVFFTSSVLITQLNLYLNRPINSCLKSPNSCLFLAL